MTSSKKQGDAGMRPVQQQEQSKSPFASSETEPVKPVTATGKSFTDIPIYPGDHAIQPKLSVNTPGDKYEQQADTIADKVVQSTANENQAIQKKEVTSISPLVQAKGESLWPVSESLNSKISSSKGKGTSLDRKTLSTMSGKFGVDFSKVKIHADNESATMNKEINAKAFTIGNDIYFNKNQYQPGTKEGKRLLAHELTHTVQQKDTDVISRKTLGDIPEATRKLLRISRISPEQATIDSWLKEYFGANDPGSKGLTVVTEFSADITDPVIQQGLRHIAHEMRGSAAAKVDDPESLPLSLNRILDFELDLSAKGGDKAIYRFVRYMDGKEEKMLVEKKHIIGKATAAKTTPGATTYTGTVSIGNVKVEIGSSFGNDKGKVLVDAIQLLPESIRAKIDGVKIAFEQTGTAPGGEYGDYVAAEDTVHIWNNMFNKTPRKVGEASENIYGIVHELGHVIDVRPLAKPQIEYDKLMGQKKTLQAQMRTAGTIDATGEETKETREAKAKTKNEIGELDKKIEDVAKQIDSAKSISGEELGEDTESLTTDFGKALKADGVKVVTGAKERNKQVAAGKKPEFTLDAGITLYGDKNLREAFAENFSIYILDEELLKLIRPATHKFFVKAFPKTVKR